MSLIWHKIRVKIGYDSNGWKLLRADGNYKLKDYTDLRYVETPLNSYDVDLIIDKGKRPSQICKDNKAEIGGNCCFAFKDNKGIYSPLGILVKDEKFIQSGSSTTQKWADFILPLDNKPYIGQIKDAKGIKLGFSGTSQIVKDSKIYVTTFIEETPLDVKTGRHPRTALGINKDKTKLIYCVVDGRSPVDTGLRLDELAAVMISLGSDQAINLDGGGSCSFVVNGKAENYQAKQGERPTSSALIFKKKR